VVYNGYLYVIGGQDVANARLSDVQYAPINANGTLGSWTATTSFTTARSSHATAVYDGYVYVVGGWDTAGTRLADVQYARINANGTLGAWAATTSFTEARSSQVTIIYNGYMYVTGGNGISGRLSDVQYAKIDAQKDVEMGTWAATTILGAGSGAKSTQILTRSGHGTAVYNGYMYLLGGVNAGTTVTSVHYVPFNTDGTVGTWVANGTSLPSARAGLTSVAVNGYLYAFGGQDAAGAYTTTSYYAPINANGSVGTWTTTTALPVAISEVGVASYNGYMYVTGGTTGTGVFVNSVRYAAINANGTLAASWTSGTNLTANRGLHASMAYNGFLYVIGGFDGTTPFATSHIAPINANGSIGAWSSTTSMPNARYYIEARIYNGYVFVAGGRTSAGSDNSSTTYAKINADGTLGTWVMGTNFTTARNNHGTEIYNGYIYITGGWDGTTYNGDVQYASLATVMGGTQAWQAATATNLSSYGQGAAVYNNFIYNIGGFGGGGYRNQVRYAPLNADGTVGAWVTSANVLNKPRFNGYAVVYKGYMYMTGGQENTGVFTNTTEYAPINADGTVGVWTLSPNTFTTARYGHVSVAYNGRLYVIGGGDSANVALGDVKYATINANGSIGTWSDTTATTAARDTDGFVYGGRVYIFGGVNGTTYSNAVRYALINSDGTLGTWVTSSSSFATGRSRHAVAVLNGYVYVSGGGTSGLFADLQYAPINGDGTIGAWRTGNNHAAVAGAPPTYAYHSMVANKGRLYSFSGINGSNAEQSVVFMTGVNAPALTGVYSRQVNLGQPSTLNSITMNGLTPPDQSIGLFRTAGSDGVYGSWQLPSVLSGTPATNVQYVMYKVGFDDSNNSSLSVTGGRSSVTDITIDYTIPVTLTPDNRLRHNKFFDPSGVLQPLQTP
jgi:N-acetylneuraminic acid mutarotase